MVETGLGSRSRTKASLVQTCQERHGTSSVRQSISRAAATGFDLFYCFREAMMEQERSEPKTVDEAVQREVEAIARHQASRLTEDLRDRGILGPDEEVVWEWEDVEWKDGSGS